MRIVACRVRCTNRQNKEHSVRVEGATVYEAACRAWSIFNLDDYVREETYKTDDFIVESNGKTYRVNLEKLLKYLDRGRKGREDTPHKKKLRWLKTAFIRIKHGE